MLFRGLLFATGFLSLGGLFICSFSCVFWAKLAVGLVILARNPSSGALATLLVRVLGEVGDRAFLTASEALGLVDCAAFGTTGAKEMCPGFGNVGDRGEVFAVVFPGSAVISCLGGETL